MHRTGIVNVQNLREQKNGGSHGVRACTLLQDMILQFKFSSYHVGRAKKNIQKFRVLGLSTSHLQAFLLHYL